VGPGPKRIAHALAHRTAFPHSVMTAGEARDVEDVEYVAVSPRSGWPFLNVPTAAASQSVQPFAHLPSRLVRLGSCDHFDRISVFFSKNKLAPAHEHKLESLVSARIQFPVQQSAFVLLCFTVLWGTWFPKISECSSKAIKSP